MVVCLSEGNWSYQRPEDLKSLKLWNVKQPPARQSSFEQWSQLSRTLSKYHKASISIVPIVYPPHTVYAFWTEDNHAHCCLKVKSDVSDAHWKDKKTDLTSSCFCFHFILPSSCLTAPVGPLCIVYMTARHPRTHTSHIYVLAHHVQYERKKDDGFT